MQSKLGSLIESVVGTLIGLVIALAAQTFMFYVTDVHVTTEQNLTILLGMTLISVVRTYVLRRFFNGAWIVTMRSKWKGIIG